MSDLVENFRLTARNNRYANAALAEACRALGEEGVWAPGVSFFPSIGETLNHILAIDLYYLDALEEGRKGRAIFNDFEDIRDLDALLDAQKGADMRLIAFCDGLADHDPARAVLTDRGEDGWVPERIDALLPHLMLHDVHHRGQIHAMLAGTAVAPPQLDDFFLEHGRTPIAAAAIAIDRMA